MGQRSRQVNRSEAFNGLKNVRGTVATNRSPDSENSATCQFFINVRDNPNFDYRDPKSKSPETSNREGGIEEAGAEEIGASALPNVLPEDFGYCVFGQVIRGMDAEWTSSTKLRINQPITIQAVQEIRSNP